MSKPRKDPCVRYSCILEKCTTKNDYNADLCKKELDNLLDCCRNFGPNKAPCCQGFHELDQFYAEMGIDNTGNDNRAK